jgi:hypothetical protein
VLTPCCAGIADEGFQVERARDIPILEELASDIVLASLILASFSSVNEPIGLNGIAEPPLRWRTARELSLALLTAL